MSSVGAVYVMSVAARLCGLHPQTLRSYERAGVVTPVRSGGGQRRYSDADVAVLKAVSWYAARGVPLWAAVRLVGLEREVVRLGGCVSEREPSAGGGDAGSAGGGATGTGERG